MRFFLIAGERSGDLHGARLTSALKKRFPKAKFSGYGGDMMLDAGMELLSHYNEISYMGFWEVIKNLKTIRRAMARCKSEIESFRPDVLILIDFPGFNLRMAQFAKGLGIATAYYIAPKVWAWNEKRIKKIDRYVDRLYCILPFEVQYFHERNYEATYVGNPVLEAVEEHSGKIELNSDVKTIACLPGSRIQEVKSSLSIVNELAGKKPDWYFLVAAVDNLPISLYSESQTLDNVEVIWNKTYDILSSADAAVVVSGTATLETAFFNLPQVVCYRTSRFTYIIAKYLVKLKFISLVNLIADKEIVKELIQHEFSVKNVIDELERLVGDVDHRSKMLTAYQEIRDKIGENRASEATADFIREDFKLN